MTIEPPRSLADDLRSRDDDALLLLLQDRPDLRSPVPADIASLAARAATRSSVLRALEKLDQFTLQVVDALVVLPDRADEDDVRRLVCTDPRPALDTLLRRALVYGGRNALTLVRTVREIVVEPAGLGPPGPGELSDPVAVEALLAEAPGRARELLDSMTWGPPIGHLERADRVVDVTTARTPVEWLLARGLLVAVDRTTVALPREVALALRGGRLHREVLVEPPAVLTSRVDGTRVDQAAADAAATAVRLVDELLETWATDPPKALRAGGVSVRDRTRTAAALDVDAGQLSLLLETAHAAGLLATGGDIDDLWLPSRAFDDWRTGSTGQRWATLSSAWLDTTRVPSLAGTKDVRGKVLAPLGHELVQSRAPVVRRDVLGVLTALEPGTSPDRESVLEQLRWRTPRLFGPARQALAAATLTEAQVLGLTSADALSSHGRELLGGDEDRAAALVDRTLPEPLDHVLLQADLTAVAPGRVTAALAQRLAMVADVESRGAATVYRFSANTIRRALDAGWSTAEVMDLLAAHSRTPVPQPLSYLVEDVARRHGRVRVGVASSYLRCDDETTVAELLADRRAASLRLRRLAPTVLAAQAPVDLVLATLREMGHAPAAESAEGAIVVRRPDARRAATPRPVPPALPAADLPVSVLAAAVRAIRAGDRASTVAKRDRGASGDRPATPGGGPPSAATVDVLALLSEALVTGETVWIGYVDAHGQASQRLIEPLVLEGGFVDAFDQLRQERRTFAVHRITGAAVIDEPLSRESTT